MFIPRFDSGQKVFCRSPLVQWNIGTIVNVDWRDPELPYLIVGPDGEEVWCFEDEVDPYDVYSAL